MLCFLRSLHHPLHYVIKMAQVFVERVDEGIFDVQIFLRVFFRTRRTSPWIAGSMCSVPEMITMRSHISKYTFSIIWTAANVFPDEERPEKQMRAGAPNWGHAGRSYRLLSSAAAGAVTSRGCARCGISFTAHLLIWQT